jgi:hypothetical protein
MADLTADECARISTHLGYEVVVPFSDYVTVYLHPAYTRCNGSAAALTVVRDLLTKADTAWAKYNASLTKQELEGAGDIRFHAAGEQRLLRTHRVIATRLARALGVRTNFAGRGGIKYR